MILSSLARFTPGSNLVVHCRAAPRLLSVTLQQRSFPVFVRFYVDSPHHDSSSVTPAEVKPKSPNEASLEALQKNFGHLKDPINKPLDLWQVTLLHSKGCLECLAEINSTEFYVAKIDSKTLLEKYQEQLVYFESVRKPALEAEGVSGRITYYLHEIYKLRANVPLWELNRAVKYTRFLRDSEYRVTFGTLERFPAWRQAKGQFLNTTWFNPAFDPARNDIKKTNAEEAAYNVKFFRGFRGFLKAASIGLTDEQKDHLFKALEAQFVSPDDQEKIRAIGEEVKRLGENKENKSNLSALIDSAFKTYPAGTPERKLLNSYLLPSTGKTQSTEEGKLSIFKPSRFYEKVTEIVSKKKDASRELALGRLSKVMEFLVSPETQRDLKLLYLLRKTKLNRKQQMELFSIFEDTQDSDTLLNDAVNPHPIASKLWGDRVAELTYEDVHYTKQFHEGSETIFPLVDDKPKLKEHWERISKNNRGVLSPTPVEPFNSALEEIYHLKLERLAQFYRFDLETDLGAIKFDLFTRIYDVSPGEPTLERTHPYPPPHHTYDELPILKFDGYDPLTLNEQ